MKRELEDCFGTECHIIGVSTVGDIINGWNAMGDSGVIIDAVVFDFHSSNKSFVITGENNKAIG